MEIFCFEPSFSNQYQKVLLLNIPKIEYTVYVLKFQILYSFLSGMANSVDADQTSP